MNVLTGQHTRLQFLNDLGRLETLNSRGSLVEHLQPPQNVIFDSIFNQRCFKIFNEILFLIYMHARLFVDFLHVCAQGNDFIRAVHMHAGQ